MQLTQTISRYDRDNASLSLLVDKIAHFNENELQTLPFSKIPGDVVADVYTVRQISADREKKRRTKKGNRFWSTENFCCFF
uniref:Type I site-specific deoxyribonuclease n=2 Tax=Bursaphelenchus xylophilus TaxID=6326 RepID=A0A1I7S3Q2_BURXY